MKNKYKNEGEFIAGEFLPKTMKLGGVQFHLRGNLLVGKLSNGRIVKLEFGKHIQSDKRYSVGFKVIDKNQGIIDSNYLKFNAYVGTKENQPFVWINSNTFSWYYPMASYVLKDIRKDLSGLISLYK